MLHEVLHNYHYYRIHPDICQLILPDYQYHQQLYNQQGKDCFLGMLRATAKLAL